MDHLTPPSAAPPPRTLPVLRALIDALDHEVLQLLARRNALVAEIAEVKRHERVPIRDFAREREILDDRCGRAQRLGLSPEVIESIWRLVLWASRDRQAALKAEVPIGLEQKTVAIIGGKGGMGRCVAGLFGDLGHAVMISDLDTTLTPEAAAAAADVVVISVPIHVTTRVIRELAPLVRPDALLMDVTSIKAEPLAEMLAGCRGSVVGTHPLFGPSVHSLQGQRIVLTRGRGDAWFEWLRQMLEARGLTTLAATAQEHDQAMGIVQVLTHFSTEVVGRTLEDLDVSIARTLEFTSPIYLIELLMTARHFAQSPELYAAIQMNNPATPQVTEAFVNAAERLRQIVLDRREGELVALFGALRARFGPFTAQALEQSSFLIDRLVERA